MINHKKVVVVMPAYNAAATLENTYRDIPAGIVDEVLLVDDQSHDQTVEIAKKLGLKVFVHEKNSGYGANQKTCYRKALECGADIVVMLHPDYQYPPKLINTMAAMVASGMFDIVLGSRILGGRALSGGMPRYKYIANRLLTLVENMLLGQKLSEYHTGYRAFSRQVLLDLPLLENSDDFIFDNQIIAQGFYFGYQVGEFTAPAVYTQDSSSINFKRSVVYGFGVLFTAIKFRLQIWKLGNFRIFKKNAKKIIL